MASKERKQEDMSEDMIACQGSNNKVESSISKFENKSAENDAVGSRIKSEDGHILKFYLLNSGFDQDEYYSLLSSKGISTLKELQELFCDKNKFGDSLKDLPESEIKNFQDELEKTLTDAVYHEELLTKLGLTDYFPEKITLPMVREKSLEEVSTLQDAPWFLLSKLLILDCSGRDDTLPNETERDNDSVEEDMLSYLNCEHQEHSSSFLPHPLDVMVAVFQCSSNFLRQILCEKMFMCKLSIPLALPPFLSNKSKILIWALRNITLSDTNSNGKHVDRSSVTCPTIMISFVKLGKVPRSKSKFLNEILIGQSHDIYFHNDCKNGMMERNLSKELIEIAWHIPSSYTKDISRTAALINFRGDGSIHITKKHTLLKCSNIIFVMANLSEIRQPNIVSSLQSVTSGDADLILMLSKDSHTKFDTKCKEDVKYIAKELEGSNFKVENIVLDFTGNGVKNIKELKEETINKINKFLLKKQEGFCLENLGSLEVTPRNFIIDEHVAECTESRAMVKQLLHGINIETSINVKEKHLPLQCSPWQEWAILSKEEHRLKHIKSENTLEQYVGWIQKEKINLREKQRTIFTKPNVFFETFLKDLLETKDIKRKYYLKWLKLHLDDISRKTIPHLQNGYNAKWNQIYQLKDAVPENLLKELNMMERNIVEASLGLEHLLREIGQVYEAFNDKKNQAMINDKETSIVEKLSSLPEAIAELLLDGCPIELMDGDASCIPLVWIRAVFHKLGALVGKEKKFFILSVLGLQSSGKSTLLNTMFGLQFSVAAGRCTRGVYAQLIPIKQKHLGLEYDYMLVVDSEGLKAAELGREKLEHDNEIATFVIGLGDITLINIKGENIFELQDVLQIVVNAIIKMNFGKYSLDLHPACVFIHQNANFSPKLKSGQQKFIETMNRVTKAASEQQNSSKYTRFKQIIDFDTSKHIFYAPDLWKGDPPMAPINQGYSEKINFVRKILLTEIMTKIGSHSTALDINGKLDELWKGILDQNFVFSFKNSEALGAYNILEKNVSDLKYDIKDYGLSLLNMEELRKEDDIERDLEMKYRALQNNLNKFFDESQEIDIYEQWRDNSLWKLKETYEETLHKIKGRLQYLIKSEEKAAQTSKQIKNG